MKGFFVFLITLAAIASSEVISLTDTTFDSFVTKPDSGVWFVRFYAPWCGHCKALEPTWIATSDKLADQVHFGDVDATEEYGLAHRFEIHAFPTVILFADGKQYHFDGSRTEEGLSDFALNLYKAKPSDDIPKMPNIVIVMIQKYMNKANLYLYQHPLFTCILLFCIGVVFGMCVVILIFETYHTYQMEAMYESEEEYEVCEKEEEAKPTENVEEKEVVEEQPVEETEEKKED